MLETRDTWERRDREDLRDLQEKQEKMENLVHQEMQEKLDSQDQRVREDFLGLLDLLASRVTEATVDPSDKRGKLELLDPKVQLDPGDRWEHLDRWVLLAWWVSEGVLDLEEPRENEAKPGTWENTALWVLWVSADLLVTQELPG